MQRVIPISTQPMRRNHLAEARQSEEVALLSNCPPISPTNLYTKRTICKDRELYMLAGTSYVGQTFRFLTRLAI
jgi:hypothetical protein